jgi:hypothetical protein
VTRRLEWNLRAGSALSLVRMRIGINPSNANVLNRE